MGEGGTVLLCPHQISPFQTSHVPNPPPPPPPAPSNGAVSAPVEGCPHGAGFCLRPRGCRSFVGVLPAGHPLVSYFVTGASGLIGSYVANTSQFSSCALCLSPPVRTCHSTSLLRHAEGVHWKGGGG